MTYLAPHVHPRSGLALDISTVLGNAANDALTRAATVAVSIPAVYQNRARAAAAVNLGYEAVDTFEKYRLALFVGGMVGALASGYGLVRRRKTPEAVALYTITGLISMGVAWVSKPRTEAGEAAVSAATAPTAPPSPHAPGTAKRLLAWTDRRVDTLTQEDPGWEARTLARLWGDVGTGTMPPVVNALLTRSH